MPGYAREKIEPIYTTTGAWHASTRIPYVAHAIRADGSAVKLKPEIDEAAGNDPMRHPDQRYWRAKSGTQMTHDPMVQNNLKRAGAIRRIEIDCKLMPCTRASGCLYQVPYLIRTLYGLDSVALYIFSHANENMAGKGTGNTSSKRVIICNTSDSEAELVRNYGNHDGWGWIPQT